jgi:type II secretion system (T2SS) protein E
MAQEIDAYRDWLGIQETARPLNHYQLLRLKPFEDDAAQINSNYRKMNAHVRKFAAGEHAERSQEILNELAKAMLCLTDSQRKQEYDSALGRTEQAIGRRRTFEQVLLSGKVVDHEQIIKAKSFADAVGLDIHEAVIQQKMAQPDVVMLAYAESQGLPYVELEDVGVDVQLVPQIPATLARQHSCVPLMADGGQLLIASPTPIVPDVEEELRLRLGMPVRSVLCTPAAINKMISKFYPWDSPAVAPSPAQAEKPAKKKEKAIVKPPAEPLSADERIKRRIQASIVAFNLTVIAYVFIKYALGTMPSFSMVLTAGFLGIIVAGITFGVMVATKQ